VRREQNQILENLKRNVSEKLKISWEEYLKKLPSFGNAGEKETTPEKQDSERVEEKEKKILDSFLPGAERNIKKLLVLREIGKREKIEASDEEVSKEIEKLLKQYPTPEEAQKGLGFDPQELKEYTKETIRNEKIFAFLERK
jgi:FKBP-type peptidyl-prolyl cis-trans isomerase (trigger factor)